MPAMDLLMSGQRASDVTLQFSPKWRFIFLHFYLQLSVFLLCNKYFFNHYVHLHNGIDKNTSIIIGNNVFIGPEVKFFCASHQIGPETQRAGAGTYGSIIVEDGVWIGANVTIFPNVTISKGSIIGACAVVTKSTEANGLYIGFPAKKIKDL